MTAIPQLGVPDILVDDVEGWQGPQEKTEDDAPAAQGQSTAGNSGTEHRSWTSGVDLSLHDTAYHHPLSLPRGGPSAARHRPAGSASSFELQDDAAADQEVAGQRNSEVSPAQLRDMLDDSVWVESIPRSATIRRSGRGP